MGKGQSLNAKYAAMMGRMTLMGASPATPTSLKKKKMNQPLFVPIADEVVEDTNQYEYQPQQTTQQAKAEETREEILFWNENRRAR